LPCVCKRLQDVGALGERSRKGFRARRTGRLHSRAGGMKENDAAQRRARRRTPPARRAGAVHRLSREAARMDEASAGGAWGERRGEWMMAGCVGTRLLLAAASLYFLFALGFGVAGTATDFP
jgi:hypothetical protein